MNLKTKASVSLVESVKISTPKVLVTIMKGLVPVPKVWFVSIDILLSSVTNLIDKEAVHMEAHATINIHKRLF